MPGDQLTLILLGAFWAGTSAVLAGIKNTNDVRDRIIIGKFDKEPLLDPHLRRLLFLDWLPMKLALAAVSLVLGVIILLLPRLANETAVEAGFPIVCYVASAVPFAGFVTFLVSGWIEFDYMREVIRKRAEENRGTEKSSQI